jgi:hypothetical protein
LLPLLERGDERGGNRSLQTVGAAELQGEHCQTEVSGLLRSKQSEESPNFLSYLTRMLFKGRDKLIVHIQQIFWRFPLALPVSLERESCSC